MARSRFSALGLLTLLLGATSMASAQDEAARAQAREQFGAGVQRYEAQNYQGALEAFQEAYRLAPHPMVRVNMANCYEQLRRPLEAMHHFERFLAESPSASRQQRREVETALRRLQQQIGELQLSIAPDGARVTIDAAETRRAPILEPVRLSAGTHRVEVRLDGYRSERRELEIVGGQTVRVSIQLERGDDSRPAVAAAVAPARRPPPAAETPAPAAAPPPSAAAATPPAVTAAPPPSTASDEPEPEAELEPSAEPSEVPSLDGGPGFELRLTTPIWIAGGAAVALTLATVVGGALALAANGDFEEAVLRSNDPGRSQAEREQARLDGLAAADTANTASIVTDVFLIGTIATAGLTLFLLVAEGMDGDDSAERAGRPRLLAAPSVGRDGGGLVLQGSF